MMKAMKIIQQNIDGNDEIRRNLCAKLYQTFFSISNINITDRFYPLNKILNIFQYFQQLEIWVVTFSKFKLLIILSRMLFEEMWDCRRYRWGSLSHVSTLQESTYDNLMHTLIVYIHECDNGVYIE